MAAGADYVDAKDSAVDAFGRIQQSEGRRLLVRDTEGRMVGVISTTDLLRAVQIRLAGQDVGGGPPSAQGRAG